MPLYVVPRTRAWLSEEEVAAATDCVPAVNATLSGTSGGSAPTSWARTTGPSARTACTRPAGPEVLRRHADALGLPTDAIKAVTATIVAAPDPEPAISD